MPGKKLFFFAGESSGDLHGAKIAAALRTLSPRLELTGFGGAQMKAAGVRVLEDPTQIAVIGVVEVLKNLSKFRALFRRAVQTLDDEKPDMVVLIDYPGFNLRFAREVKQRGIRLVYYISPQLWAWNPGRISAIKNLVNRMLVVFPFEQALYEKAGVPVTFVGHPLLEIARPKIQRMEALEKLGFEDSLPVIGLLPGSRAGEIQRILPVMLKAGEQLKEKLPSSARFLLIKAPHLPWEIYQPLLAASSLMPKVVERWDYDCIYACDLVMVTSGTATLECALLERPMVIVYKTSWGTYALSRLLIRIPYIGLVNVVLGKKTVPELIQKNASPRKIADTLLALWDSAEKRKEMVDAYRTMRQSLGEPGADHRAAEAILKELSLS